MADLDIHYDPITLNSGPVTVGVTGLDNVKVEGKLAVTEPIETASTVTISVPETVKSDSKFSLTIPDPIRSEAKADIDLRPVVVDQCLRLSLGPLPPTQVCVPSRQRLGLTVFGIEVLGLTFEGETRMVVSDRPQPPHVASVSSGTHSHAAKDAGPREPFVVRVSR